MGTTAKRTPGPWTVGEDDALDGVPFIPLFGQGGDGDGENDRTLCEVTSTLGEGGNWFISHSDREAAETVSDGPGGDNFEVT